MLPCSALGGDSHGPRRRRHRGSSIAQTIPPTTSTSWSWGMSASRCARPTLDPTRRQRSAYVVAGATARHRRRGSRHRRRLAAARSPTTDPGALRRYSPATAETLRTLLSSEHQPTAAPSHLPHRHRPPTPPGTAACCATLTGQVCRTSSRRNMPGSEAAYTRSQLRRLLHRSRLALAPPRRARARIRTANTISPISSDGAGRRPDGQRR